MLCNGPRSVCQSITFKQISCSSDPVLGSGIYFSGLLLGHIKRVPSMWGSTPRIYLNCQEENLTRSPSTRSRPPGWGLTLVASRHFGSEDMVFWSIQLVFSFLNGLSEISLVAIDELTDQDSFKFLDKGNCPEIPLFAFPQVLQLLPAHPHHLD